MHTLMSIALMIAKKRMEVTQDSIHSHRWEDENMWSVHTMEHSSDMLQHG